MSYAPCKNPNCKSYGQPHPNCRCYGGMAEGGEVSFCGEPREHESGCAFYKKGGVVSFDDLKEDEPTETSFDDLEEDPPTPEAKDVPQFDDLVDDSEKPAATPPEGTNEELSPHDLQAKMVAAAHPEGVSKYETGPQQLATVAEGLSRGVAGEAATLAENKLLGVPLEDIRGREAANPGEAIGSEATSLVGGLITGTGEAALATKAAQALADYGRLSKVGAGVLKGLLANGSMVATDAISKAMLGENPEVPVGALLATGLGGLIGGAGAKAGSLASSKLTSLAEEKMGTKAASWLAGFGAATDPTGRKLGPNILERAAEGRFSSEAFESGKKAFAEAMGKVGKVAKPVSVAGAAVYGYHEDGTAGALHRGAEAYALGKAGSLAVKALGKVASKVGPPVVMKILSSGTTSGILDALDHADRVANGIKMVDDGVDSLFRGGGTAVGRGIGKRKELEEWLESGGADEDVQQEIYQQHAPEAAQGFAKGGHVSQTPKTDNGVALHFPEQNMLISAAKGRASNYLNTLRPADPKHQARLAFDDPPDDRQKKKAYDKALDVAASPLSVLDEIKRGTVEPEHIKHLNALFPELTGLLQQKITERITKAQLSGEKPNAKVRQGLSMLLGTPLSGELLPQNIQAAQAVFASGRQRAQEQQASSGGAPTESKPKTRPLSKSDRSYLTDDQARMARQQRQT